MYKKITIESWNRKPQYEFFKTFDQPFFNVTANVDISHFYGKIKERELPFFYSFLHQLLTTVHRIPEFKYRLQNEEVRAYTTINAGVTILKKDQTFFYGSLTYQEPLVDFVKNSQKAIEEQIEKKGFVPHTAANVVYVSSLPWVSFTGFQHARKKDSTDSIPRFVLGKYFKEKEQLKLPISVEVHHALADGFHVGQFFKFLQEALDDF